MLETKDLKYADKSLVEKIDATNLSAEEVLAQIENSMETMNENNQRRIVFTNSNETFDDVVDKLD